MSEENSSEKRMREFLLQSVGVSSSDRLTQCYIVCEPKIKGAYLFCCMFYSKNIFCEK